MKTIVVIKDLRNNKNISFYSDNSSALFNQYQSLSFDTVHQSWLGSVNLSLYKTALDIGAGSGRDSLALHELGVMRYRHRASTIPYE